MPDQSRPLVAHIQDLLADHTYTPAQIADTAIHALYPQLSEGSSATYAQLGRGATLIDLRELAEGRLQTSYVPSNMLGQFPAASEIFDLAAATVAQYDPLREFVAIVWQPTLLLVYRLDQL